MRRPHPELLTFAGRVLAHEAERSPQNDLTPFESACEALQRHLDRMIGLRGFHALLSRAIFLTRVEHPWLVPLRVAEQNGCALEGVAEATKAGAGEAPAGFAAVIATTITLLASFIGEDLTIRILRDAWPDVPLERNVLPEGSMYE
jgi:hypothetical protein